jgi:hypothetical protein
MSIKYNIFHHVKKNFYDLKIPNCKWDSWNKLEFNKRIKFSNGKLLDKKNKIYNSIFVKIHNSLVISLLLWLATVCSALITFYLQNSFANFSCKYIKFLHFRRHIRNKNLPINSFFDKTFDVKYYYNNIFFINL